MREGQVSTMAGTQLGLELRQALTILRRHLSGSILGSGLRSQYVPTV